MADFYCVYCCTGIFYVLCGNSRKDGCITHVPVYLVPFKEIKRFVNHFWQLGLTAVLANIAGNVVAFMPFGFCLPLIADHRIKFFGCMLYTFGLSLAIELIQLVSKVGSFDVDDLMLNTLGGVLGYLTFLCYKKMCQFHRKRKKS